MSDFVIAIFLTLSIYLSAIANAHNEAQQEQIVALQEVNSFLWAEGENVTARLKQCEKRKKR